MSSSSDQSQKPDADALDSLGYQQLMQPHQPLGLSDTPHLQFYRPVGAQSLAVLDPSIFSAGEASPVQAFLEPFQNNAVFQQKRPLAPNNGGNNAPVNPLQSEPIEPSLSPIQRQPIDPIATPSQDTEPINAISSQPIEPIEHSPTSIQFPSAEKISAEKIEVQPASAQLPAVQLSPTSPPQINEPQSNELHESQVTELQLNESKPVQLQPSLSKPDQLQANRLETATSPAIEHDIPTIQADAINPIDKSHDFYPNPTPQLLNDNSETIVPDAVLPTEQPLAQLSDQLPDQLSTQQLEIQARSSEALISESPETSTVNAIDLPIVTASTPSIQAQSSPAQADSTGYNSIDELGSEAVTETNSSDLLSRSLEPPFPSPKPFSEILAAEPITSIVPTQAPEIQSQNIQPQELQPQNIQPQNIPTSTSAPNIQAEFNSAPIDSAPINLAQTLNFTDALSTEINPSTSVAPSLESQSQEPQSQEPQPQEPALNPSPEVLTSALIPANTQTQLTQIQSQEIPSQNIQQSIQLQNIPASTSVPNIQAEFDSAQVDSGLVDSAQVDSAQVDSAQVDSAQVDSTITASTGISSSTSVAPLLESQSQELQFQESQPQEPAPNPTPEVLTSASIPTNTQTQLTQIQSQDIQSQDIPASTSEPNIQAEFDSAQVDSAPNIQAQVDSAQIFDSADTASTEIPLSTSETPSLESQSQEPQSQEPQSQELPLNPVPEVLTSPSIPANTQTQLPQIQFQEIQSQDIPVSASAPNIQAKFDLAPIKSELIDSSSVDSSPVDSSPVDSPQIFNLTDEASPEITSSTAATPSLDSQSQALSSNFSPEEFVAKSIDSNASIDVSEMPIAKTQQPTIQKSQISTAEELEKISTPEIAASEPVKPVTEELDGIAATADPIDSSGDSRESIPQLPTVLQNLTVLQSLNSPTIAAKLQTAPSSIPESVPPIDRISPKSSESPAYNSPPNRDWQDSPYPDLHPYEIPQPTIQTKPADIQAERQPESPEAINDSIPDREAASSSGNPQSSPQNPDSAAQSVEKLEKLAQAMYRLLRQRLALERERSGNSYAGRLPW